ncbi:MAG: phage terminase large subunit, partial [Ignavibacteriaceae bacterium]
MITQIDLDKDSIIFNPSQVIMFNKVFEEGETGLVLNSNKYHEFAHFGAFRCGKSFEMQLIAFLLAIYYKNLRILYVRSTYDQLIDSVISQMNHDFGKYSQYKYFSSKRDAVFYRTNSQISFRAFDVDTKILSNEYDAIFLCQGEELKEAFFLQLFGRLSGGNLPKACLFLEGNPSNNFVKRRYKDRTAEELDRNKIIFVESGTAENQEHIPEDYIERLKANYPASWINRYVYGGWDQIDEMVFSEFRENLHVIDPLTIEECKLFKVIQGFDYGWINETAIVWCYVDYDGNLTIFEEWGGSYKYNDEISENALK